MNLHLARIGATVAPGACAVLMLDDASWHRSGDRLRVPGNIILLHPPPYAPESNPLQNVPAYLHVNTLSNSVFDTDDAIVDRRCPAWNWLASSQID